MAKEIERKFVCTKEEVETYVKDMYLTPTEIVQHYLNWDPEIRIRHSSVIGRDEDHYTMCIKSVDVDTRDETEIKIDRNAYYRFKALSLGRVVKYRYSYVDQRDHKWCFDIFGYRFGGSNEERALVEVEQLGATPLDVLEPLPFMVGREVTKDRRYYNAQIALNGFPPEEPILGSE